MGRRKADKDVEKRDTIEENPMIPTKKKRKGIPKCKKSTEELRNKSSASSSQEDENGGSGFFGCYMLTSLSPRFKGCTYIGFTVNPRRRIRQHNGEITSGAWRTKSKRPWEMVLCIYGFPTNVSALQFEWAWQHPRESIAVREAAMSFKSFGGVASKIKLAYTMLKLPAWQRLNLTVNFFSTKYTKHTAGCPTLPEHVKVRVCSMDDLPCYSGINWDSYELDDYDDEECDQIGGTQDLEEEEGSVESTCSHNSTDGKEEIIEENQKWDQENHRRDFSWVITRSNNTFGEDSGFKFHHETNKLPETIVIGDQHTCPVTSHKTCEVEIIDICTPPPCIRNTIKKRTISTSCSELIDLTESPVYIKS